MVTILKELLNKTHSLQLLTQWITCKTASPGALVDNKLSHEEYEILAAHS